MRVACSQQRRRRAMPDDMLAELGEVLSEELERQELSGDHDEPHADAIAAAAVIEAYLRKTDRHDEAGQIAMRCARLINDA